MTQTQTTLTTHTPTCNTAFSSLHRPSIRSSPSCPTLQSLRSTDSPLPGNDMATYLFPLPEIYIQKLASSFQSMAISSHRKAGSLRVRPSVSRADTLAARPQYAEDNTPRPLGTLSLNVTCAFPSPLSLPDLALAADPAQSCTSSQPHISTPTPTPPSHLTRNGASDTSHVDTREATSRSTSDQHAPKHIDTTTRKPKRKPNLTLSLTSTSASTKPTTSTASTIFGPLPTFGDKPFSLEPEKPEKLDVLSMVGPLTPFSHAVLYLARSATTETKKTKPEPVERPRSEASGSKEELRERATSYRKEMAKSTASRMSTLARKGGGSTANSSQASGDATSRSKPKKRSRVPKPKQALPSSISNENFWAGGWGRSTKRKVTSKGDGDVVGKRMVEDGYFRGLLF